MLSLLLSCPMCFGDPSSEMATAAKWGVTFMLGVVFCVLFAIAMVARSWAKRARELDRAAAAQSHA
jgi:hypothetical protein